MDQLFLSRYAVLAITYGSLMSVGGEMGRPMTELGGLARQVMSTSNGDAPPVLRTITRLYTEATIRERDIAQMRSHSWTIESITSFSGGWYVVYSTTAQPGQALLPDHVGGTQDWSRIASALGVERAPHEYAAELGLLVHPYSRDGAMCLMPNPETEARDLMLAVQRTQNDLLILRKRLDADIHAIRVAYDVARSRVGTGLGMVLGTALFEWGMLGRANTAQREQLRAGQSSDAAAYEHVQFRIDQALLDLDSLGLEIERDLLNMERERL